MKLQLGNNRRLLLREENYRELHPKAARYADGFRKKIPIRGIERLIRMNQRKKKVIQFQKENPNKGN